MEPKFNTILLVDDDEATNYIHQWVIEQADCAINIIVKQSAMEALEYLISPIDDGYPQPDLIFLDINMPAMDGWEFLEEYNKLNDNQLAKTVIVMLSTSLNPADKNKANAIPLISGFMSKPLTAEKLEELHQQYFKAFNELEK